MRTRGEVLAGLYEAEGGEEWLSDAAVKAAVEAGSQQVKDLGTLIAAHVIARPSEAVLELLPVAAG